MSTSSSSAGTAYWVLEVVAEPVRDRLEIGEGLHVGLLLRRIRAARREGNLHVVPGVLRGLLDRGATAEHDQVGERHLLAAGLRGVERLLNALKGLQHLRQLGRLVDLPILLRRKTDARPVRPAALVGAAEGRRRGPGGRDQLGDGKSRCEDLGLEVRDVLRVDQLVIDGGDGVLPDQFLRRNLRAEVACARAHVAMRQLEPRPGEGVRELIRVLVEAPRDLLVDRVDPQREVGGQHGRRVPLRWVERIRNCRGVALRLPLIGAGRALGQLPFVAEQVLEEAVAPLRRRRGPGDFRAAGDRVCAFAGAEAALPAEALLLDGRRLPARGPPATHRRRRASCRSCVRRR